MKTRIIYPSLWDQDRVIDLSVDAKVLLFNLLTTGYLGLTRYLRTSDNRVCMETGLKKPGLAAARKELESCDVHYFDGWYFMGCDFAYIDYEGRDRVMEAKQRELDSVPGSVITYFEGVKNPLETSDKLDLNYKPKTLNPKLGDTQGEEEMKMLWKDLVGTTLRTHLEENLGAYRFLEKELGAELPDYLGAVRMIRADHYQPRKLQAKLINYAGLRECLEQVEAYMQGHLDRKHIEPVIYDAS